MTFRLAMKRLQVCLVVINDLLMTEKQLKLLELASLLIDSTFQPIMAKFSSSEMSNSDVFSYLSWAVKQLTNQDSLSKIVIILPYIKYEAALKW